MRHDPLEPLQLRGQTKGSLLFHVGRVLPFDWIELLDDATSPIPVNDDLKALVVRGLEVRFGPEVIALPADEMHQSREWFLAQEPFHGLLGINQLVDRGTPISTGVVLRVVRAGWLRDNPDLWDIDGLGFMVHKDNVLALAYAPHAFCYATDITRPVESEGHEPTFCAPASIADPFKRTVARRHFLQRRDQLDAEEAFAAFEKLFTYYSLHEELARLGELMKHLPYALDEDPRMDKYRVLLDRQIGHLRLGESRGAEDWYANGSPSNVVSADFARTQFCASAGSHRLRWFADECRKRKVTRALEMGSVDGFSLFQLMNYAPEIQWEGLELSAAAVAHGHEVAKETDHALKLHHAENGFDAWVHEDVGGRQHRTYEAAALFEILEHNPDATNEGLILTAIDALAARGFLFITTPCGNWSAFDEGTRVLDLPKDHVNAFTVKRMRAFLERPFFQGEFNILEVKEVPNQTLQENNSWVFALCQKR